MSMFHLIVLAIAVWAAPAGAQTASPESDGTPRIQEPPPYRVLTPGPLASEAFAARDGESGPAVSVWGFVLGAGQTNDEGQLEKAWSCSSGPGGGFSHLVPAGMLFRTENFDDPAPFSRRGVLLRDDG